MHFTLRSLGVICFAMLLVVGCYKPATTPTIVPPPDYSKSGSAQVAALPKASSIPTAAASPTASPSATADSKATSPVATASATGTKPSDPKPTPSATADKYVRPARTNLPVQPPTPTRSSRNPVRKTAGNEPPPRTRVLEAPSAEAGVTAITFDNLMFPMERDDPFSPNLLTDAVRSLFDKKIKIRGFIHPSCPYETGVKSFILVRDDQGCCFGPGALLYDCIIVDMVPGRTTNFSTRPVAVQGLLKFREYKDLNGKHEAIFHLDAESVE
ncbi:MAG: hypothetical protein JNK76_00010 [Planctomycetales bacterium]|nr:hypothetical protein [Planctomycetales bacterium]MBN8625293.1 hypothetical protein [Planctomycetota bacterium]